MYSRSDIVVGVVKDEKTGQQDIICNIPEHFAVLVLCELTEKLRARATVAMLEEMGVKLNVPREPPAPGESCGRYFMVSVGEVDERGSRQMERRQCNLDAGHGGDCAVR